MQFLIKFDQKMKMMVQLVSIHFVQYGGLCEVTQSRVSSLIMITWTNYGKTSLQPIIKGRVINVQTQMSKFNVLFGLKLCVRILKITDNLSKTLQKDSLSAAEAQDVTKLTVTTLKKMRADNDFDLFFKLVKSLQENTNSREN